MYATDGVVGILGVRPEQLVNKSFYFCIAPECLSDAVRCLENAKSNDSIAYLRFRFRNPVIEERHRAAAAQGDAQSSDEDDDDGGVPLQRPDRPATSSSERASRSKGVSPTPLHSKKEEASPRRAGNVENKSRSTSGHSTDLGEGSNDAIFGDPSAERSSASSMDQGDDAALYFEPVEVEAVVSCTSDGLVVVLRRARASPQPSGPFPPFQYEDNLFASPWATHASATGVPPEPHMVKVNGLSAVSVTDPESDALPGPATDTVMNAIREVAVFAWSLAGINGSLVQHGRGQPEGQALPADGLPVWDPGSDHPENDRFNGFAPNSHRCRASEQVEAVGGGGGGGSSSSSSEDEVVYKRAKTMPEWKKPIRRGHRDAFGPHDEGVAVDEVHAPARKRKVDLK